MINKNKVYFVTILFLFISITVLFVFSYFLVNCIKLYSRFDLDYDDLICEELKFERIEEKEYKSGSSFFIYFKEYEQAFEISNITSIKLDKLSVSKIKQGEKIKVYYCKDFSYKDEFLICEMQYNETTLLGIEDFKEE